jgi:putative CocE/NonD family hydrolase
MDIKRSGSQPSGKGSAEYFTGTVRVDPLFEAPDPARVRGASVTFERGARYRTSFTTPELLEPDVIYELHLNLWATANVFLPGHRMRLEVSSSNFPRFARNSNTGGDIVYETADQYQPAINRIVHDAAHPSCLILPIIER